jgi:FKBP-type peptidyl-prolyl cis-trans isomerase
MGILESIFMYIMACFVSLCMNNSLYAAEPIQPSAIIQEVERGIGKRVQRGDRITVYYAAYDSEENGGAMIDYRGKSDPFTFSLGSTEVDDAFTAGILGANSHPPMKEGGKRRLFVPAGAGYFDKDVHFDVHLVKIHSQD